MDSVHGFVDALEAFADRVAEVNWGFLTAAVAFSLANILLRCRAWQVILRTAVPGERFRYRSVFGSYFGGVAVNAVIPARVGDVVKMFLVRRGAPTARYPTLVGTLVAETTFDFFVAGAILTWALWAGVLPGVRLPDLNAFDISLAARHPWITLAACLVLLVLILFGIRRIRRFWQQFGQGLAIFRRPGRYFTQVVPLQAVGWGCRLAGAACFLEAYNIPASLEAALVVQAAGSLSGLLPATPGGLGPKQALLVVMLAGTAGRTDVLAFSVGMELTLMVVNLAIGFTCILLMVRSLRFRELIRRARADEADPAGG
ncbi:MAG: lysylphosphatidylglycerol synthase transmembrane domain-containing protein [Thermoleophilia bacterium]